MQKTCYIVSLKYAPGLAQLFSVFGRQLARHGWRVQYLLAGGYAWQFEEGEDSIVYFGQSSGYSDMVRDTLGGRQPLLQTVRRLFAEHPPDLVFIYNPHPLNGAVLKVAAEMHPCGSRCLYLHEPYVPDKSSYGFVGTVRITAAEYLQARTLAHTTCVVVPSEHACRLFRRRFPKYPGPVYVAPLLLPDAPTQSSLPRRWVSLTGNINKSRGLEEFLALVCYTVRVNQPISFRFLGRTPIRKYLNGFPPEAAERLSLVNKPRISDEEIAVTASESLALFLPHRQAAQSGTVPVAFRAGTPIIARNIPGLAQHVQHGETGYLFSSQPEPEELFAAVLYVRDHFDRLSKNARSDFERRFSEKNWGRYYTWLIRDD